MSTEDPRHHSPITGLDLEACPPPCGSVPLIASNYVPLTRPPVKSRLETRERDEGRRSAPRNMDIKFLRLTRSSPAWTARSGVRVAANVRGEDPDAMLRVCAVKGFSAIIADLR